MIGENFWESYNNESFFQGRTCEEWCQIIPYIKFTERTSDKWKSLLEKLAKKFTISDIIKICSNARNFDPDITQNNGKTYLYHLHAILGLDNLEPLLNAKLPMIIKFKYYDKIYTIENIKQKCCSIQLPLYFLKFHLGCENIPEPWHIFKDERQIVDFQLPPSAYNIKNNDMVYIYNDVDPNPDFHIFVNMNPWHPHGIIHQISVRNSTTFYDLMNIIEIQTGAKRNINNRWQFLEKRDDGHGLQPLRHSINDTLISHGIHNGSTVLLQIRHCAG